MVSKVYYKANLHIFLYQQLSKFNQNCCRTCNLWTESFFILVSAKEIYFTKIFIYLYQVVMAFGCHVVSSVEPMGMSQDNETMICQILSDLRPGKIRVDTHIKF